MVDYRLEIGNGRRIGWKACKVALTFSPLGLGGGGLSVPISHYIAEWPLIEAGVFPNYNREFRVHRCNRANKLYIDQVWQKRKVL